MEFRDQDPIDREPTVKKHPTKAVIAILTALALFAASILWYALGRPAQEDGTSWDGSELHSVQERVIAA